MKARFAFATWKYDVYGRRGQNDKKGTVPILISLPWLTFSV